jgi:predicted ATPase/class 3 adenylate cyclase
METMPTGTVTLLFSDIEGSTVLLSRLGPAYAEVLSAQREVLRAAWAAHGGTEMGTEGDSFLVAFATAPAAVAAAVQAQLGLAARDWPGGASVHVRMGIHTGNPTVHDGGYVGMDVHRAARIAGSAHGGQVVVSAATAELIGAALPADVRLRDLGSYRLKDLPAPERLFQLTGAGLLDQFPALKTLGSASSLPRPATDLVGRDGELAELADLLGSAGVRLVTLTGPGGSGKTRLAIGVAQRLVDHYPDGVFFVPLAAVTTPEVMWTAIAEVLDLPPEARTPPAFFAHVAHRRALFVLDNLEQLDGADSIVADLLREAPHTVIIATTRRPLHLAAEHEHAVPPLDLAAEHADLTTAQRSGAVQLFVQQARRVKSSFALSAENLTDVVALCRRLDGLPLAIELAAARSKLLSPRGLLARLDEALDLRESGADRPTRQQTLRATIGWSYDLLDSGQQAFFRRLAVFAGGANTEAITAVTTDLDTHSDAFDILTDLVDASLITVSEDVDGGPRVALLETIRAFAKGQLATHGELDDACRVHAKHYLKLSQELRPLMFTEHRQAASTRFQTEQDNLREALNWALTPSDHTRDDEQRILIGLGLVDGLATLWEPIGYPAQARAWASTAISQAGNNNSVELADVLGDFAHMLMQSREFDRAHEYASASVGVLRKLNDAYRLPGAVCTLAQLEMERGRTDEAFGLFEEAADLARSVGDVDARSSRQLRRILGSFAQVEYVRGEYQRSLDLAEEVIDLSRRAGDIYMVQGVRQNIACTLRLMGRLTEAEEEMRAIIPQVLNFNEPYSVIGVTEDYGAILADLGDSRRALEMFGAADAMRARLGIPRLPSQDSEMAGPIAKTRRELTETDWKDAWQAGGSTPIEEALMDAYASRASISDRVLG